MASITEAKTVNVNKEKKLKLKLRKLEHVLSSKEKIEISKDTTQILCVQNGGLGNGVSREELLLVFQPFGSVADLVMIPRKQYSFVTFQNLQSASAAHQHLNGFLLRKGKDSTQDVKLYLFYVEKAPSSLMSSWEIPPGLHIIENFVSEEVEGNLLRLFSEECGESQAVGMMKHRRVKHFGYEFRYDTNDVDIHKPLPGGMPLVFQEILQKASCLGLIDHMPDQLTINHYEPGQGIPPHVDTVDAFEDGILSLSLGSQTVMDFRHPDGRHLMVLVPRRSLLVMTGESRYVWSHGITPRKLDNVPTPAGDGLTLQSRCARTSFTFRKVVLNRKQEEGSEGNVTPSGKHVPQNEEEAKQLEKQHVHKVYDEIAEHFSGTRYKPWPRVVDFLLEQPPFSLLVDVGCGNGKYLGINKNIFQIGGDYSKNLASICRSRGFETSVVDVTCLPFRSCSFDVVLCIAVIHHMSTQERRIKAISEVVRILRAGGQALIYVWAMEQDHGKSPSTYITSRKQKQHSGNMNGNILQEKNEPVRTEKLKECDNDDKLKMTGLIVANNDLNASTTAAVTHTTQSINVRKKLDSNISGDNQADISRDNQADFSEENQTDFSGDNQADTGSSESMPHSATGVSLESLRKSKALQVHVNRTQFKEQDMLVPWQLKPSQTKANTTQTKENTKQTRRSLTHTGSMENNTTQPEERGRQTQECRTQTEESRTSPTQTEKSQVFHRFYHMFRQGEVEALCKKVAKCVVDRSYHDQGNWCIVLRKL